MCVWNISKSYERILVTFCGDVEHGLRRNWLDFGDDLDSFVEDHFPGFFTISRYGVSWHFAVCLSKLWTNFDEIYWTDGAWPKDQSDSGGDPDQYPDPQIQGSWIQIADPGIFKGLYYLRQVNRVNDGDTVFVWYVCVCLCVRSGLVNQTSLKQLKLRTSHLTSVFPGTVQTWSLKNYYRYSVKIHLAEICTLTSAFKFTIVISI